jgi:hypothetical protein
MCNILLLNSLFIFLFIFLHCVVSKVIIKYNTSGKAISQEGKREKKERTSLLLEKMYTHTT